MLGSQPEMKIAPAVIRIRTAKTDDPVGAGDAGGGERYLRGLAIWEYTEAPGCRAGRGAVSTSDEAHPREERWRPQIERTVL